MTARLAAAGGVRGHGMDRHERAIIDLWDGGASIQAIAKRTGFRLSSVEVAVKRYHFRRTDQQWEDEARAATLKLAAAIAVTGGRWG